MLVFTIKKVKRMFCSCCAKKSNLIHFIKASIAGHRVLQEKQFFFSQSRVNQFHSSVVPLASHHWYPDKEVLRQYLGKDLLVSDEEWKKIVENGYHMVTDSIFNSKFKFDNTFDAC